MSPDYIITAWFTVGMFFHVAPKLPKITDVRNFVILLVFSLFVALLPGKNDHPYVLDDHLIQYFFMAMMFTFFAFRDSLIPKINEHIVAINTVLLCYAIVFLIPSSLAPVVIVISILPTALALQSIVQRRELDQMTQVILYFWNEVMYIIIFFVQFDEFTKILPSFGQSAYPPVMQIISSGMMFAAIFLPIMGLFYIIPVPGKRQSLSERIAEIKDYMAHIAENFSEENSSPAKVLVTALLAWGILYLNRLYMLVPEFTAMNVLIIFLPYLIKPHKPDPVQTRILTMEQILPAQK